MDVAIEQKMRDIDNEGDKKARTTEDGSIPCATWDLDITPIRLPSIPYLLELLITG
jgi:SCF-associated factor 1